MRERTPKEEARFQRMVYWITIVFSVLYLIVGNRIAMQGMLNFGTDAAAKPIKAVALEILDRRVHSYDMGEGATVENVEISFRARILSGAMKDSEIYATQTIDAFMPVKIKEVEVGDRFLMYQSGSGADSEWYFGEYLRTDYLIGLTAIFLLLILIFGRKKGVNTIISLGFTCLAVFAVFVPSVMSGQNIYAWSIITCLFIITMTLLIVYGWNQKSFNAAMGCAGGVMVSGILILIMDRLLQLTGVLDEESSYLLFMRPENPIDLKAVIFGSIIIGAVGAVMDVAMSISSALKELYDQVDRPTFGLLMRSGITIGRDIMGTMANTLVLAYIGSSLSMVVLLAAYSNSLLGLLNQERMVVEVLQTLIGSLGILFTIPLTSLVSSFVYTRGTARPALNAPVAPGGPEAGKEDEIQPKNAADAPDAAVPKVGAAQLPATESSSETAAPGEAEAGKGTATQSEPVPHVGAAQLTATESPSETMAPEGSETRNDAEGRPVPVPAESVPETDGSSIR